MPDDLDALYEQYLVEQMGAPRAPQAPPARPSFMQSFGEGVREAPTAFVEGVKATGNFALNPIDTIREAGAERTLDTTGKIASALAGGTGGAKLGAGIGAVGGPIGAGVGGLIGGALGTGAGLLGFKKARQLTGTLPPSQEGEDISELGYDIGSTLASAGLGKAAGGGLRAAGRAAKGVAGLSDELAQGYKEVALGAKKNEFVKGLRRSSGFLDESGTPIQGPQAAKQIEGLVDRSIKILDQDGFFKDSPNSGSGVKIALEKRKVELAKKADILSRQAERGLPKNGRIRHEPRWDRIKEYIDKEADPVSKKTLKSKVKLIEADWKNMNGRLSDLVKFRRKIAKTKDFKGTISAEESEIASLKRRVYGEIKEAIEKNYETGIRAIKPELAGKLKEVNKKLSAYKTFDDTVLGRIADDGLTSFLNNSLNIPGGGIGLATGLLTRDPVLGVGAALARGATYQFPISSAKALGRASRGATSGSRALGQAGRAVSKASTPVAATATAVDPFEQAFRQMMIDSLRR
jgi:hypothetical protein